MPKVTIWATWLLIILGSLLVVLLAVFIAIMFSDTVEKCVGQILGLSDKNKTLTFLGIGMGGILLALQAVIANRRAKAMEDTAKAQAKATAEQAKANQNIEQGQRQERLKNAIEHLGHDSASVRLGGAYELFHLAQDTKELRQTAMDILCAHIRRTTGEAAYRETHQSKPSEEVQSLLTLLFVQDHKVFKDLHINLQGSWLNKADLMKARLDGANLMRVHLQGANLREAHLPGANLRAAHLQGASLMRAHLPGANLRAAHLQAASLMRAHLPGADLRRAHLQGASLMRAHLPGADLRRAHLQGASLMRAHLPGADLRSAHLPGARLWEAHLPGANLREAHLPGANLRAADLCGANFYKAHFQETDLRSAKLQGVRSDWKDSRLPLADRIRNAINKESDLSRVIFTGGLSPDDVDSIVIDLPDENATELRAKLEPHISKPASNELPEDSGAITGAYTAEEAEEWIAEYEKAMSEVPKTANGQ